MPSKATASKTKPCYCIGPEERAFASQLVEHAAVLFGCDTVTARVKLISLFRAAENCFWVKGLVNKAECYGGYWGGQHYIGMMAEHASRGLRELLEEQP